MKMEVLFRYFEFHCENIYIWYRYRKDYFDQNNFQKRTKAKQYFLSLSRSDKRNILQWLVLAKKQETREN
jgi:hypothetical protein